MPQPLLLLVDDSAEMGLIVGSLGRRAGWDVRTCEDAEAAWQALPARRPDLVLLDVNLPGVNGLDWLRRVRAAPEFADLRVALYTHWGLPADVAAGLDAGVDFVFDKDLASRPADWQQRLAEIGQGRESGERAAWPDARGAPTIEVGERFVPPPIVWMTAFEQALRHPSLRRMTREVLPALWRRTLTHAGGPEILSPDRLARITPDGREPKRMPPPCAPASPVTVALCLAEQIRRILGDAAGAAFREALAAQPGLREFLSWP